MEKIISQPGVVAKGSKSKEKENIVYEVLKLADGTVVQVPKDSIVAQTPLEEKATKEWYKGQKISVGNYDFVYNAHPDEIAKAIREASPTNPVQVKVKGETVTKPDGSTKKVITYDVENISEVVNSTAIMVDYKRMLKNLQDPNTNKQGVYMDTTDIQDALEAVSGYTALKDQVIKATTKTTPPKPEKNEVLDTLKEVAKNTRKEAVEAEKEAIKQGVN